MDRMTKIIDYLKAYCTYCIFDHCSLCAEFHQKHGVHRCKIDNPHHYAKYTSFIESKGYVMIDSSDKSLLGEAIEEVDDEEDEDAGEAICCGQRTTLTSIGFGERGLNVQLCTRCYSKYCWYCSKLIDFEFYSSGAIYELEADPFEGLCVECLKS